MSGKGGTYASQAQPLMDPKNVVLSIEKFDRDTGPLLDVDKNGLLVAGFGKRNNLRILGYHSITDGPSPLNDWCHLEVSEFEKQMSWLAAQDVDVLPLDKGFFAMRDGRLKRNSVAVTFDDGFRNNVSVALPILQKYSLPATIFLTTGPTDRKKGLWPGRIVSALERTNKRSIGWHGDTISLATAEARKHANVKLQAMVKTYSPANPNIAAAEIEQLLEVPEEMEVSVKSPHSMISRTELEAALASGLISFGAHSVTHPILSALDDQQLANEIGDSIDTVEKTTGEKCISFAYPNGRSCDFDERAVTLLRKHSIELAVTAEDGPNCIGGDPFRLHRWLIGRPDGLTVFKENLPKYNSTAFC